MKKRKLIIGFCVVIIVIILLEGSIEFIKYKKNKTNNIPAEETENISDEKKLDEIYNNEIVKNYKDIRKLPIEYSIEDARKDNCFVISKMVENNYSYKEFMNKFNKKESAFIRVVQTTIEGDLFLVDLLYDSKSNLISLVKDDTRDKFSSEEDRIIWTNNYEKTGIWEYMGTNYWVVYNGELPKGNSEEEYQLNKKSIYIITEIK